MDSNSKFDFSSMGLPPEDSRRIVLASSFVVEIGEHAHVPLVVPFGSLESVVRMALSAGMSVSIGVVYNSGFYLWKKEVSEIEGLTKSDV